MMRKTLLAGIAALTDSAPAADNDEDLGDYYWRSREDSNLRPSV